MEKQTGDRKPDELYPWERKVDKRRGPDFWVKSLTWLGMIGWFILVVSLGIVDRAKPQTKNFFGQRLGTEVKEELAWNENLTFIFLILMLSGLMISMGGLIINSTRMKRKDDEYRLSLILVGLFSIVGTIFYFVGMH